MPGETIHGADGQIQKSVRVVHEVECMLRELFRWVPVMVLLVTAMPVFAEVEEDEDQLINPAHALPVARDLRALGEESRRAGVPILLMFSSYSCGHCRQLEEEVLRPMRLSGMDPKQVIVRKVMLDEYANLTLFSGKAREADHYAYKDQGISVVPTVALKDQDGNDLVPKIVGYGTPGFYESYLDEAIKVSGQLLKQR